MSVREVLQLGIKGQDIILSALKKIQTEKLKFAKKATIPLGVGPGAPAPSSTPEPTPEPAEKPPKPKPEKEKHTVRDVAQGLASMEAGTALKATFKGVGSTLGVFGGQVGEALAMTVDVLQKFSANVRQASSSVADSEDIKSRVLNLIGGYPAAGYQRGFLREAAGPDKGRMDISVSMQRTIVEALGSKFGIVGKELQASVRRIFGTGQTPTDVTQATQLATGNFSALGTDKGFFLQKIADSFSGLPPSVRQKMTAEMLNMIPEKDLFKQTAEQTKAQTAEATFEDLDRQRAKDMLKVPTNVSQAQDIQRLMNTLDTGMNNVVGTLLGVVRGQKDAVEALKDVAAGLKGLTGGAVKAHP